MKSVPIGKKHLPITASDKIDYKQETAKYGKFFVKIHKKTTKS
jgi:hypothetical protein